MPETLPRPDAPRGHPADDLSYTRRVVIAVGIAVTAFVVLAFLWRALPIVLLAFGAVLFAVLLRGIAGGLRRAAPRVPEKASVGLAAALFVGVLVGFGFFVAPRISEEASALAEQLPRSAASCSGLPAPSSPSPCSWRCSRSSRRCT